MLEFGIHTVSHCWSQHSKHWILSHTQNQTFPNASPAFPITRLIHFYIPNMECTISQKTILGFCMIFSTMGFEAHGILMFSKVFFPVISACVTKLPDSTSVFDAWGLGWPNRPRTCTVMVRSVVGRWAWLHGRMRCNAVWLMHMMMMRNGICFHVQPPWDAVSHNAYVVGHVLWRNADNAAGASAACVVLCWPCVQRGHHCHVVWFAWHCTTLPVFAPQWPLGPVPIWTSPQRLSPLQLQP